MAITYNAFMQCLAANVGQLMATHIGALRTYKQLCAQHKAQNTCYLGTIKANCNACLYGTGTARAIRHRNKIKQLVQLRQKIRAAVRG